MRMCPAQFLGQATMMVAAAFLAVSLGNAQQAGQAGDGATPSTPGKGTLTPAPPPAPTPNPVTPPQTPPQIPHAVWVTGRVMMYDGSQPPERVIMETVCSGNTARSQGYTDPKGAFSVSVGPNSGFTDVSTSRIRDQVGETSVVAEGTGGNSNPLVGCDLRARLSGYRSDTVSLTGHWLDSPNVGAIVLYPIAAIQGLIASATSAQAPKDARKAYEKGLDSVKKDKADQAELEFRKAVQLYPKHAAAWLELGKILEKKERYPEAREAYASALAADSKFVYPYEQLYRLALREKNWKDVVEKTDQLTHLDPYEFPNAYYFNALAHFELKEYDAAEKSAHQAVEADRKHSNPKVHYLLGAIKIQTKDWTGAAESFRAYLIAVPDAPEKAQVEKTLGQLEQQINRCSRSRRGFIRTTIVAQFVLASAL